MKRVVIIFLSVLFFTCTSRKTETSETPIDSVAVDSASSLADQPAPPSLAFDMVAGFSAKNTVALSDSVNFFIFKDATEFDKTFTGSQGKPDFGINFVVGVICLPTERATSIVLEKVEVADDINVYFNITRGETQKQTVKPAAVFAIERRDGINAMQFFVNGKKDKALLLIAM